jgi:hypothetical protein
MKPTAAAVGYSQPGRPGWCLQWIQPASLNNPVQHEAEALFDKGSSQQMNSSYCIWVFISA